MKVSRPDEKKSTTTTSSPAPAGREIPADATMAKLRSRAESAEARLAELVEAVEQQNATIAHMALRHHDSLRPSRKHDPASREWYECDCLTCLAAQDALRAAADRAGGDDG